MADEVLEMTMDIYFHLLTPTNRKSVRTLEKVSKKKN